MTSIQHNHIDFIDKRRHLRHKCNILASIKLGAMQVANCIVKDISIGGAKIVISNDTWLPSKFSLDIDDGRPALDAEKVWIDGNYTGLKFNR